MRESQDEEKKMRIVMILYNSLPTDIRVFKEARVLSNAGYDITVLDAEFKRGNFPVPEGIRRCTLLKLNLSKRTSIGGLLLFWIACLKYLVRNRPSIDVVHAHDLSGLPPAFVISILCPRIRLVYDSHELFPEAAMDKLSFLHYVVFLGLELICSTRVSWLLSVSPSILKTLSRRIGGHSFLLMNVPDLERIQSCLGYIPRWDGPRDSNIIKIACPGNVSIQRGYEKLPETAQILNENYNYEFNFIVIGDGPLLPDLRKMVQERKLEKSFTFLGRVGFEKALQLTVECDVGLALYEKTWNNDSGLSNKIFDYMMVGIPFVFTDLTQSLPLLEMVEAYILETPFSSKDVANAILSLLGNTTRMDNISKAGIHLVADRFNWARESERLLRAYEDIHSDVIKSIALGGERISADL